MEGSLSQQIGQRGTRVCTPWTSGFGYVGGYGDMTGTAIVSGDASVPPLTTPRLSFVTCGGRPLPLRYAGRCRPAPSCRCLPTICPPFRASE